MSLIYWERKSEKQVVKRGCSKDIFIFWPGFLFSYMLTRVVMRVICAIFSGIQLIVFSFYIFAFFFFFQP